MSESIDRRVVEMRFDNKDFEQNVNTTMTALDKLKEKLSFKGAEKGFKDVSEAAKSTDFKGLGSAVETVQAKFSALEVMALTALSNITNSAVNAGKKLVSAFTIDPIKTGFQEYETQINAVQTILANTSSKGTKLEDVNKALDELNHYADKTIYNFTEMTRNIGTFTAAGIELDTSVNAIQGIANLAAVSGSNAQQASTAMYQLSQALASGTVKLQDWNSVVNAGMGGEVFQNALKETAKLHGIAVDEMIKKNGSFRESLREGWITADILTETLKKFTVSGVNEYLADNTDLSKKQIESMRESADASEDWEKAYRDMAKTMSKNSELTEDQIFEYLKMSKTAEDAATKVKTFSQLMDTLKEAAQSGWTQTWEILIGDFNEAKGLFTGISDVLSNLINASSDARNKVLQEWKDLGGRDDILAAFKNLFTAFKNIVAPIHDAFRNVFPPTTAKQLLAFSTGLEQLTKKLIITDETARKINKVFTVLFSVLKTGLSVVKSIFSIFGSFAKLFLPVGGTALDLMSNISGAMMKMADGADILSEKLSVFTKGLLGKAVEGLGNLFAFLGKAISHIDLGKVAALLAGGGILSAGLKISKLAGTIREKLEGLFGKDGESKGGLKDRINDTLSSLSDTLNQFQASLKVGQLVTIAISLGILAASCATLANIPAKKLAIAVGAIGGLFTELGIASHLMKGAQTEGIIKMAVAVVILANAVKKMSEIESMGKGLIGVGVILGELTAFCLIFDRLKIKPEALNKTSSGLILMAVAINLLSKPVKELGAMDVGSLIKGLGAVAAMLTGFTLTAKAFAKIETKGLVKAGAAMVVMAVAIRMLAKPLAQLGSMDLGSLAKGLGGMAVALGELVGFTAVMGVIAKSTGNIMRVSAALLVMSVGIKIMAGAIKQMGSDSGAGKGLSVMFGSLVILAGAMALMQKSLAGAAAMIVVAGALAVMAPAIALLSSLNFGGVAAGLLALAGTLTIFGAASMLLAPVIPLMLALGAAMALLGVGVLSLGAGMTMLTAAFSMATGPIVEGATAMATAFPIIAKGIGDGIITTIKAIGDGAEAIKVAFVQIINALISAAYDTIPNLITAGIALLTALLQGIEQNIGKLTVTAANIVTGFINAISEKLPEIVNAGFNFMISFLDAMANAISDNGDRLATAFANVILAALAAVVGLIPGFGKTAKDAIDKYREGLADGKDPVAKTAHGISSDVNRNLKISDQTSNGLRAGRNLNGGLQQGGKTAGASAKKIASTVSTNLKIKDQTSNGENAVRGLKNGMDSLIGPLRSTANKIASIVDETIRKKNQIKSPSRRLYKTGAYMMQGLIGGLDSLTSTYQNKANNIATVMVSSVNRSIDSVNSMMAQGFDTNLSVNETVTRALDISVSMDKLNDRNTELSKQLARLTDSLDGVTDTMNSRQMVNNIHVDGAEDPGLFADKLVRSMKLNARTI